MKFLRENFKIYPFLLAIYPIFFIASYNPGQWKVASLSLVLGLALFSLFVLYFTAQWTLKKGGRFNPLGESFVEKLPLVLALFIVVFFLYGPVYSYCELLLMATPEKKTNPRQAFAYRHAHEILSLGAFVILAAGTQAIRKMTSVNVIVINRFLRGMSFILVAMVSIQLLTQTLAGSPKKSTESFLTRTPHSESAIPKKLPMGSQAQETLPDIYYFIMDGYARTDVFKKYYDFNNKPFVRQLKDRGFEVKKKAHSNYSWTFLSLTSVLNFDYLQTLMPEDLIPEEKDRLPAYELIKNNETIRFLKQRGYHTVHIASTWGATLDNPYADEQISCHQGLSGDPFFRVVAEASWLSALAPNMGVSIAQCHLWNFETLKKMGPVPGPKFVFMHFVPPHHPYLFDEHGNILKNPSLSDQFQYQERVWEKRKAYLSQAKFMNKRMIETIDQILADAEKAGKPSPIMILHSDHGPNLSRNLDPDTTKRIRMANFAAYRIPGSKSDAIPQDVSLVNQMRYIFNTVFGANLPILPDQYYYSRFDRPYQLRDITDTIRTPEPTQSGE